MLKIIIIKDEKKNSKQKYRCYLVDALSISSRHIIYQVIEATMKNIKKKKVKKKMEV